MAIRFKFQQEDTSVYEFKVEIGKKVLVSVCKEKEEAANKYDDAIASGHGAYMLSTGKKEKEKKDQYQRKEIHARECITRGEDY